MQLPFPGMDPYLEAPRLWPDVHNRLTFAICDQIQPHLSPRYTAVITPYATSEEITITPARVLVPDVALVQHDRPLPQHEPVVIAPATLMGEVALDEPAQYRRIEIRVVGEETLVTVIEILSPANKRPGADADAYERKRRDLLRSAVHLLEVDLLRGGRRPSVTTPLPVAPYFIFLSRAEQRPQIAIWPLALQQALPVVPVPLRGPDPDVPLDLNQALQRIYTSARYDLRIDYQQQPPTPALSSEELAWIDAHLRTAGQRA